MDLDEDAVREHLASVRQEHRDMDDAIATMVEAENVNMLQIQRLKKRKLSLKDDIERLRSLLVPDIIA